MEGLRNALEGLGAALGSLLEGLRGALEGLGDALEGLGAALGSPLEGLGSALEGLGDALEGLAWKSLPDRPPRIHEPASALKLIYLWIYIYIYSS